MNHSTRKTDKDCNVCGDAVEIVCNAASQCSNRNCITRDRDNNLGTDASASEVAEYYQAKDVIDQQAIDDAVVEAYQKYDRTGEADHHGQVAALLPFSSYQGWGDLRTEVRIT